MTLSRVYLHTLKNIPIKISITLLHAATPGTPLDHSTAMLSTYHHLILLTHLVTTLRLVADGLFLVKNQTLIKH